MTIEYLDKRENARKIINNIIEDIDALSYAFKITGNQKVSKELDYCLLALENAKNLYEESFNMLFNDAYNASQQATVNMVQSAINVITKMKD